MEDLTLNTAVVARDIAALTVPQALHRLQSRREGLTPAEAAARLRTHGAFATSVFIVARSAGSMTSSSMAWPGEVAFDGYQVCTVSVRSPSTTLLNEWPTV